MLIWGSKGKVKDLESGQFYCPHCGELRPYTHKKIAKYFTLYFIPLFETENKGEFIECGACGQFFPPEVLKVKPPTVEEQLVNLIHTGLERGIPIHLLIQRLVDCKMPGGDAMVLVFNIAGNNLMACYQCNFLYWKNIKRCSFCSHELVPITKEEMLASGDSVFSKKLR